MFDGQAYGFYTNAFRTCCHLHTHPEDFYTDPEPESKTLDEKSEDDLEEPADVHPLADFEAFARRRPKEDFIRVELLGTLRSREMDHDHDWSFHIGRYNMSPEIWDQVKIKNLRF